jgi:hypothetical protein
MSDLHAETALWIDGLRQRADKAEQRLATTDSFRDQRRDADERLARFRTGLDLMGSDKKDATPEERTTLETMADDLDEAVESFLVKLKNAAE